jgi:uncharacterized protein (DUF433 family)
MDVETVMRLEDYFDFSDFEHHGEVRVQGHRIWLHDVLFEYVGNGLSTPQQLLERFPTLAMDEVLACLLYYHANREMMDSMLANYLEYRERSRQDWERSNPEKVARMRSWVLDQLAEPERIR